MRAAIGLPVGFLVASVPLTNLAARVLRGVDLRDVRSGTVSGTGLFEVAGFLPLAVVGIGEVAKGALGPWLVGEKLGLRALSAAGAIVGHDWSLFLKGAGGRGFAPALGVMLVTAPAGTAVLLAGMVSGRLLGESALGCLVAYALVVPICWRVHGRDGAVCAATTVAPMILKRLTGNRPASSLSTYLYRLFLDRDTLHSRSEVNR